MVLQGYRMCGVCRSKPVAKAFKDHCADCLKICTSPFVKDCNKHIGWGGTERI